MRSSSRLSLLLALTAAFGTGCSSMIVRKPDIQQVRKVALISITAPQRVPHKSGRGEVSGWDKDNRTAIADQALATYAAEFKKLGWEILPTSQLSELAVYKEHFSPRLSKADNAVGNALNALSTLSAETTYFSPTGLFPIAWEEDNGQPGAMRLDLGTFSLEQSKTLKTKMQEVASQAGVDAAILVQTDYCYDDGAIWVGQANSGTGSAVITGASAVYGITPKGVEVIKMKRIPSACGGEKRVASDTNTAMIKGHLLYDNDRIRKMFQEVARKWPGRWPKGTSS